MNGILKMMSGEELLMLQVLNGEAAREVVHRELSRRAGVLEARPQEGAYWSDDVAVAEKKDDAKLAA
jgi:hypothetical protein